METPDKWVLLEIEKGNKKYLKLFVTWYGGYLSGDSWKLSSHILTQVLEDDYWYFYTASENCYRCHKDMYGMGAYSAQVLNSWVNDLPADVTLKVLDEPL